MGKMFKNFVSWLRKKVFKRRAGKKGQKKQGKCSPTIQQSIDSKTVKSDPVIAIGSGSNLDKPVKLEQEKYRTTVRLPPIAQEYQKANVKVAKLPPLSISTTRTGNLAFEVSIQGLRPVTARGRRPFHEKKNSTLTAAKPLQLLDQINAKAALVSANRERHLQALKERLQKSEENAQRIRERKSQSLIEVLKINEVEDGGTESSSDTAASSIPAVCQSANAKKLSSDFAAQPEEDKEEMDEIEGSSDNSISTLLQATPKAMYSSTEESRSADQEGEMVKQKFVVFNSKVELITEEEDEDDENKLVVKRSQLDIKDEKDVKRHYGRHESRAYCRGLKTDMEDDDDDDNIDISTGSFINEESIDSFLEEMEEKEQLSASDEKLRPGNPVMRRRYFVYEKDRMLDPQYSTADTYTDMADDRLNYALGRMWKSELKDPDDCTVLEAPVIKKYYDAEFSDDDQESSESHNTTTIEEEEDYVSSTLSSPTLSSTTFSSASLDAETVQVPYRRRYLPEPRSSILNDYPHPPLLPAYHSLPPLTMLNEFSNRHNTSVHVADKLEKEALKVEKRRTLTTLRRCGIVREDPLLTRPVTSRTVCLSQKEEIDWHKFEKETYRPYSPVLSSNSSLSSRPPHACYRSRKLLNRRVYQSPNKLPKIAEEEVPTTFSLPKIRNAPITSQHQGVTENLNQNRMKSNSEKCYTDVNGRLHIWTKYIHR